MLHPLARRFLLLSLPVSVLFRLSPPDDARFREQQVAKVAAVVHPRMNTAAAMRSVEMERIALPETDAPLPSLSVPAGC